MRIEGKQLENMSHLAAFLLLYNLWICSSWKTDTSFPEWRDVYIKITSCNIYSKVLNRGFSFFNRCFTENILHLLYLQKTKYFKINIYNTFNIYGTKILWAESQTI